MPAKRIFDRIDTVEIRNVSKHYKDTTAVGDLNLTIHGGELLVLVGSSGSGKTTTLRMINRMIEPDEGEILINGMNTKDMEIVDLRRNIGYVIQSIGLFPHLTIEQNIGLIPKLEGWDQEKIHQKVSELLDFVSLKPEMFLKRYPKQLSGGQQQRVGLARALVMDAPLLLMDEPFGALDPILRKQLQVEFLQIKNELQRTIVFVTHDIEEAFRLGDRIAIMDQAKLIQIGTPEELIFNPANEVVADIVGINHKYRHLESMKIQQFTQPIDNKQILETSLSVEDAIQAMSTGNFEIAFVENGSKISGYVKLIDLVNYEGKNDSVEKVISNIACIQENIPVSDAMRKMKKESLDFLIVESESGEKGILFSSEIMKNLI